MKKTIFILTVVLLIALGAGVPSGAAADKAAFKVTSGCPTPGCQTTVVLSTGVPFCTGTWCGPFGSQSFVCDSNGDAVFSCLCKGTYTWCPECTNGIYTEVVDGGPSEQAADGPFDAPCPCK